MSGAFDLLDRPLVFIPVKWAGIGKTDDGGAIRVDHVVDIQVELLDRDEFSDWIIEANKDVEREDRAAHELATIKKVAKGWRKIKAGGRDVAWNDENLAKLLLWPGFVTAFGEAYMTAWRGELETRTGNSDGSPGIGLAGEPTDVTAKGETPSS